jgi:hypothetical protein
VLRSGTGAFVRKNVIGPGENRPDESLQVTRLASAENTDVVYIVLGQSWLGRTTIRLRGSIRRVGGEREECR